MVPVLWKAGWRSASTMPGALSVTTSSVLPMLLSSAVALALLQDVHNITI